MSQEARAGLENMLRIISQVEHSASEIDEEIERYKESASERKMNLEIEKSRFQEAAKAVLYLLEDKNPFDMRPFPTLSDEVPGELKKKFGSPPF